MKRRAEPHTVRFKVANPDRDAHRILAAIRAWWQWTGHLATLERDEDGIWLSAPDEVAWQWMVSFGHVKQRHKLP